MQRRRLLGLAACFAVIIAGVGLVSAQKKSSMTGDDYIEIQQLYARYNNAIDTGDAEGYAATFIPDGVFNTYNGHDALVQFIHDWHDKMGGATRRHWNTNLTITPTADGANGSVYLLLVNVGVRPPVIFTAAMYEDQLVKTAQGWRFKHRVTKADGPPAAPAAAK
jgi:hypothetical protein